MSEQKRPLHNRETFEQLAFQRSIVWGKHLEYYSNLGTETVLNLNELSDFDECDDEALSEAIEVDEADDVLRDITNRSSLNSKNQSNASVSQALQRFHASYVENDSDCEDIVNVTRPILDEHKKQFKELGIDCILNTFDTEQIEDKVGGWLLRNNSAVSISSPDDNKNKISPYNVNDKRNVNFKMQSSCSDSESEQSVDTARYIRLNRKLRSSACMTTTTIKTFRMVQSKRKALCEKYACIEHDVTYRSKSAQCASEFKKRLHKKPHQQTPKRKLGSQQEYRDILKLRRKLRYKKRSKVSADHSTMSSSDEHLDIVSCSQRCCSLRRARKEMSLSFNTSALCSSLSSHYVSDGLDKEDLRPFKREGECDCCNDKVLCNKNRHLADTSTEEWLVQNTTPEKLISHQNSKHSARKPSDKKNETGVRFKLEDVEQSKKYHDTKHQKNPKKDKTIRSLNRNQSQKLKPNTTNLEKIDDKKYAILEQDKIECNVKPVTRRNDPAAKHTQLQYRTEPKVEKNPTESKHVQLVKPIKSLKKTNVTNNNNIGTECKTEKTKTKQSNQTETKKNPKRILTPISSDDASSDDSQQDKLKKSNRIARKIHLQGKPILTNVNKISKTIKKETEKQEKCNVKKGSKKLVISSEIDGTSQAHGAKSHVKSAKEPKSSKSLCLENDTFLSNSTNICNSTEISFNKQQQNATKKQNPTAVNTSSTRAPATAILIDDDSDCMVTSTTLSPKLLQSCQQNKSNPPQQDLKQKPMSILQRHTSNGILLYTPLDKTSAPAHCLVDNAFLVTIDHLKTIIGEEQAIKFFKYNTKRRWRFDINSEVYFRPPPPNNLSDSITDSESDDPLESADQYGELFEIKSANVKKNC